MFLSKNEKKKDHFRLKTYQDFKKGKTFKILSKVFCLVVFVFWKLKPWDGSGSEDSPNTLLDKFP